MPGPPCSRRSSSIMPSLHAHHGLCPQYTQPGGLPFCPTARLPLHGRVRDGKVSVGTPHTPAAGLPPSGVGRVMVNPSRLFWLSLTSVVLVTHCHVLPCNGCCI